MKRKEIIYYSDELNEEFSKAKIEPRLIDENFKYFHGFFWNLCSVILQNIISMPIKILYSKIKFRIKYVGKNKLKEHKFDGYFVYANHTQVFADTFLTTVPLYPKRHFLIVNPENISVKPFGTIIEMLGAIPVPNDKSAMKNFLETIKLKINQKSSIVIYPEAHIWPYYTKIRNFKSVSFSYPVKLNVPSFCITNTYQKTKKNKLQIVSYIDGPFFPNKSLSYKDAQKDLRDRIYETMCERSKNSNIEVIKYIKK